jgi:N-acetylglutamate synthase-like GNAT family acetyltransferase
MTIRPATQADQAIISAMVRAAKLNPVNLRWVNFWVAEADGRVVGVGQLVRQLVSIYPAPIYLFCADDLGSYYARTGFHRVERRELPHPLARLYLAGRLVTRVGALFNRQKGRLIAMRWDGV